MLIKVFKNGRGRGAGPVGYLIAREVVAYSDNRDALRDAAGKAVMVTRDPLPEVLRGDPARTEALIDATSHQWTYRSGVLAFTREDAPTERQQVEVMDAFERLAFAGLEPDQWDMLWVRHTHEGRVELHFVTPRMELSNGRSLNIAPPGYQKAFDALRDVENKRNGWADPQDPERARDVVSLVEHARRGQAREAIQDWLLDRIAEGKVQDRPSMVEALTEAGFQIPRAGKDYITALDPESGERTRLRGSIFREDWTRSSTGALERPGERRGDGGAGGRPGESRRLAGLDADELLGRLRAFEQKRAQYNRGRYGGSRAREPEGHQRPDRDTARGPEPNRADQALRAVGDRDLPSPEPAGRLPSPTPESPNDRDRTQRARAADWTGERIARLLRAADEGVRGLSGSIRSLGAALDGADQPAAQRLGRLRQLASQVADFVDRRLEQLRERATGLVRGGRGSEGGRGAHEPSPAIGPPGAASGLSRPQPDRSRISKARSTDRSSGHSR